MDLSSVDHLLVTTRSVRRRLDFERSVEPEVIEKCLEIAIQAPTGTNAQQWHFVIVTEADKRRVIAEHYNKAFQGYRKMLRDAAPPYEPSDPRASQRERVLDSAQYLSEHFHEAPIHVIGCIEGRVEKAGTLAQASAYGSILPAMWSLMLALRSRGLGSAWTTLHLAAEVEISKLLGIPANFTQAALLPVAYFKGEDFKPARRLPLGRVTSWNAWGRSR